MVKLRYSYLGPTHYLHAGAIQEYLVRQHLAYKAAVALNPLISNISNETRAQAHVRAHVGSGFGSMAAPPDPTILLFQASPPAYTCGRRDISALPTRLLDFLRSPILASDGSATGSSKTKDGSDLYTEPADVYESPRGGQLTFHGHGQLTAYLICDLRAQGLTVRSHVRLLEQAVQNTLLSQYGMQTVLYEDFPGVWVAGRGMNRDKVPGDNEEVDFRNLGLRREGEGRNGSDHGEKLPPDPQSRKIAAVGVHLRRHVSSFGIGLNVFTNLAYFRRMTACGLPGSLVTSIADQTGSLGQAKAKARGLSGSNGISIKDAKNHHKDVEFLGGCYVGAVAHLMSQIAGAERVEVERVDECEIWDHGHEMREWTESFRLSKEMDDRSLNKAPPYPAGSLVSR